ncbi:Crossover junction endodeoxyribonuclease RusA [Planctomycetales bacterium 10988]|nr:Crossover junction endodeoxyribonuclease RusA [Planctomycetales bacterium 10988]
MLNLPYPPSINNYYRRTRSGVYLKRRSKTFRRDVQTLLLLQRCEPIEGPLSVLIEVFPPEKKVKRDLDNILKALLDALQHAGVYEDDAHIARLLVIRRGFVTGGMVQVTIEKWEEGNAKQTNA